jgi:hypothetical protein
MNPRTKDQVKGSLHEMKGKAKENGTGHEQPQPDLEKPDCGPSPTVFTLTTLGAKEVRSRSHELMQRGP